MGQNGSRQRTQYYNQAFKLLHNMVAANDAETLYKLLKDGMFSIEELNSSDLLHYAAMYGHPNCVKVLCEYGLDVNYCDIQYGMAPLHFVGMAESDYIPRTVSQLLKFQAKVDHLGDKRCGKTALHVAIEEGNGPAVQALLEYGCSPNLVSECEKGISPLLMILLAGAQMHKSIIWKVTHTPALDIITYQMTQGFHEAHVTIFKLLLQGDTNLTQTLCEMPQGKQTQVTAVRTYQAMKAILNRLDLNHRKLAQEFLIYLFSSGFRPRGEAVTHLESYDLAAYGLMRRFFTTPQPLTDLTVKVVRKTFRCNVFYAVRMLKLEGPVRDLVTLKNPPQPLLIWL